MVIRQAIIPQKVGITKAKIVHFRLLVSFFMLIRVVLQGKCIKLNNIIFIAVRIVQPLAISIFEMVLKSSI